MTVMPIVQESIKRKKKKKKKKTQKKKHKKPTTLYLITRSSNPSGIYVVITFVEHDLLIWLGLRQNGSVFYYDAPYHSSVQLVYTQRRVCFTSVYVNFTVLNAFVELGTGVCNWGRMGPLHLGFYGANGNCEYKNFTCI